MMWAYLDDSRAEDVGGECLAFASLIARKQHESSMNFWIPRGVRPAVVAQ